MTKFLKFVLPEGLPIPVPEPDGLSTPFREGLRHNVLMLQRCGRCKTWQWGPEWICHDCHSFDMQWEQADPIGLVYAIQRVWHPVHAALKDAGPYLNCLIELPLAGKIRVVGNIVGNPMRNIAPGTTVRGVFEHHLDAEPAYTLLQWEVVDTL